MHTDSCLYWSMQRVGGFQRIHQGHACTMVVELRSGLALLWCSGQRVMCIFSVSLWASAHRVAVRGRFSLHVVCVRAHHGCADGCLFCHSSVVFGWCRRIEQGLCPGLAPQHFAAMCLSRGFVVSSFCCAVALSASAAAMAFFSFLLLCLLLASVFGLLVVLLLLRLLFACVVVYHLRNIHSSS